MADFRDAFGGETSPRSSSHGSAGDPGAPSPAMWRASLRGLLAAVLAAGQAGTTAAQETVQETTEAIAPETSSQENMAQDIIAQSTTGGGGQSGGGLVIASRGIFGAEIHLTSDNKYDDNFQGLADTAAPAANSSRGDFSTSDTIGGSATAEIGRQQLFARGAVGKTIYLRSTPFNSDLFTFGGGVNWQATSRCNGDLTVLYDQRQSDLTELTVAVANQKTTLSYGATGLCDVGSGYHAGLETRRQEFTNSAVTQSQTNRNETSIRGHAFYQLPSVTKLGVDLGYIERDFPNQSLTVNQYDVAAVFERKLDQKTYLTSQLGVSTVTASGSGTTSGSTGSATSYNPFVNVDVSYIATAKVTGDLFLSRAVSSSDDVVASVVVIDTARLSATWHVSPKVSASETVSYSISDFQGGTVGNASTALQQSREDRRFRNTASVSYDFSSRVSFNAQYTFTDQSSTLAARTFTSNAILLGLRVTY